MKHGREVEQQALAPSAQGGAIGLLVTVVDFLPPQEAENAFRTWLVEHKLRRDDIDEHDLVIDTGRGDRGTVPRYRVHRDAIPKGTDVPLRAEGEANLSVPEQLSDSGVVFGCEGLNRDAGT